MGVGFPSVVMEGFWNYIEVMGAQLVNVLNATDVCTWK